MKKVFYLFLALLFLNSCSVKKRSYRRGYYVDWAFKTQKARVRENSDTVSKNKYEHANERTVNLPEYLATEISLAEEKAINGATVLRSTNNFIHNEKDCGDIIKFKDGSELKVMVMDVTDTEVEYKPCNDLKGKLIIAEKKDIASIKYLDGTVEDFEKKVVDETLDSSGNKKKMHPMAWLILGFTIGILALLILAAGTVAILAPIAEKKILKDQDKYRGLKLIRICEEISISFLVLVAAAIVLFALYMLVIFLL